MVHAAHFVSALQILVCESPVNYFCCQPVHLPMHLMEHLWLETLPYPEAYRYSGGLGLLQNMLLLQ